MLAGTIWPPEALLEPGKKELGKRIVVVGPIIGDSVDVDANWPWPLLEPAPMKRSMSEPVL